MFIYLSKLLPLLLYPTGVVCILIFVGIFIRKWMRLQIGVLFLALVFLGLGSNRWVAYSAARSLEWQYIPQGEITAADVIVVLGGGTEAADYPRSMVEVNSAGDRIFYAAQLYRENKAKFILLSGGSIPWGDEDSQSPAKDMESLLILLGVPSESIWLEAQSRNTYENALFTTKMLREKGVNRIILVTSAMHMPRAVGLYRHQGIEVIPAPTDFTVTESGWQRLFEPSFAVQSLQLLPGVGSLSLTTKVMKEYLGILIYTLRGQI